MFVCHPRLTESTTTVLFEHSGRGRGRGRSLMCLFHHKQSPNRLQYRLLILHLSNPSVRPKELKFRQTLGYLFSPELIPGHQQDGDWPTIWVL